MRGRSVASGPTPKLLYGASTEQGTSSIEKFQARATCDTSQPPNIAVYSGKNSTLDWFLANLPTGAVGAKWYLLRKPQKPGTLKARRGLAVWVSSRAFHSSAEETALS